MMLLVFTCCMTLVIIHMFHDAVIIHMLHDAVIIHMFHDAVIIHMFHIAGYYSYVAYQDLSQSPSIKMRFL